MKELVSWYGEAHNANETSSETVERLVHEGFDLKRALDLSAKLSKRARGRPVSNRGPVLLAVEQRLLHPELSWMKLAIRFCQCGQSHHNEMCKQRIRQQAMKVEKMLTRLGVEKSSDFSTQ